MKKSIFIVVGILIVGGSVWLMNRPKSSPAVATETAGPAATVAVGETVQPAPVAVAMREPAEKARASAAPVAAPAPVVEEPKPADANAAAVARMVDLLVSPQTEFRDKQKTWLQLRESGQLDRVIAELKQRAASNPNAAEVPATLGEAYFMKIPGTTDYNQRGMLALQADQSFDDALQRAPDNWEAQFMKAMSLSYWPEGLNKGSEVIERFTALINQQEAQSPRPEFAQSYLLLGNQYQKAGNVEYAHAVWQAGATMFPGNAELRGKLAGK